MTGHRRITMLALAGILGSLGVAPAAVAAESGAVAVEEKVAVLRVEIRETDGTVVRAPTQAVQWGKTAAFQLTSQASEYELDVTVLSDAGVDLRYVHNGNVLATEPAGKRARSQVFRTVDGTEISLSVVTTRVRVEGNPA
jgi:hypothetical protein